MTAIVIVLVSLLILVGLLLLFLGGFTFKGTSDGDLGAMVLTWLGAIAIIAAVVIVSARMAHAAPPADADPALAPWFQSLTDGNGVSCCSIADCRPVDVRVGPRGWEAHIAPGKFPAAEEDTWVIIPEDKIIRNKSHPHGLATMCWMPTRGVMCFTAPAGA